MRQDIFGHFAIFISDYLFYFQSLKNNKNCLDLAVALQLPLLSGLVFAGDSR
jgi:hypothetical protein